MLKQPEHARQPDLFVAYLTDVPLRDQRDTMERPFFSLSKNKRIEPIEYTSADGKVWVKVTANNEYGMATIYDADILIWATSQIMELVNRGVENIPQTIKFHPCELLKAIGRDVGGRDYEELRAALRRLRATTVETNIRAHTKRKTAMIGWLDGWTEQINEKTKTTDYMTITIPRWLYEGIIMQGGVLSIHQDYFQLTGGYERWLYKVSRKHAGLQECGAFLSLPTLYKKSGSTRPYRSFKSDIKKIVTRDELPDYHLEWLPGKDTEGGEPVLHMIRRSKLSIDEKGFAPEHRRDRRRPKLEGATTGKRRAGKPSPQPEHDPRQPALPFPDELC